MSGTPVVQSYWAWTLRIRKFPLRTLLRSICCRTTPWTCTLFEIWPPLSTGTPFFAHVRARCKVQGSHMSLAAQRKIPTPCIAQYLFEIVSQRGIACCFSARPLFIWYHASIAEIPLFYWCIAPPSAHARARGIAPNLFMFRHHNPISRDMGVGIAQIVSK